MSALWCVCEIILLWFWFTEHQEFLKGMSSQIYYNRATGGRKRVCVCVCVCVYIWEKCVRVTGQKGKEMERKWEWFLSLVEMWRITVRLEKCSLSLSHGRITLTFTPHLTKCHTKQGALQMDEFSWISVSHIACMHAKKVLMLRLALVQSHWLVYIYIYIYK